jgi:hypothetical protein
MGHLSGWDRQGSVLVGLPSSRTFQYAQGFLKIPFSLILDVLFEVGSILNDF